MGFFARPNLDNDQFKQLSGTTLTLTGETNFIGTLKSKGVEIDATPGFLGDVLTYCGGKITLKPSSASGGTGVYTCASPTTCTVGGLTSGTPISGCTLSYILEKILVPTLSPTTINGPTAIYSISPVNGTVCEVGSTVGITGCLCLNRGWIAPQYCGTCCYRSGPSTEFWFRDIAGTTFCCACVIPALSHTMPTLPINPGNNTTCACVCYSVGPTNIYDSIGTCICAALTAGVTSTVSQSICGLYPYYYGKFASGGCPAGVNRPSACCIKNIIVSCVGTCCKVVADSAGNISINFNSTADDYLWFATPCASTTKIVWYVDALNNGTIGGSVSPGGNLFPTADCVCPISSAVPNWGGQCYKIYISNYQSASATIMQLRNS